MRNYFIILWLILCGTLLFGQEDAPRSRWSTTLGTGIDLFHSPPAQSAGTSVNSIVSRPAWLAQHFRITRFFDLGVQLGFQRTTITGSREVIDNATGLVLFTNWSTLRKNTAFGLQPRFNYRLGQGDLALAFAVGLVNHRNQASFRSPEIGRANFSAEPLTDSYYELKVGYTYWPTARFGLEFGLVRTDYRHGNNGNNLDEGGNYRFTAENFINPTQAFDPEAFQFAATEARAYFISLAVVRRW